MMALDHRRERRNGADQLCFKYYPLYTREEHP